MWIYYMKPVNTGWNKGKFRMNENINKEQSSNLEEQAKLKLLNALTDTYRTLNREQKEAAYKSIQQKTGLYKRKIKTYWMQLTRYAAVMILSFGISYLAWKQFGSVGSSMSQFAQVVAPAGQTAEITLPDGSQVVLNAASKLIYPVSFNKKTRTVSLEGEGFFKVAKDKHKPFIVSTDVYDVRVTGTQFNLSAYDGAPYTTVLVEGEVYIDWNEAGKSLRLSPGQAAVWSPGSNDLLKKTVKTDVFTNWQRGVIQFREETMKNVASYLERWYNVDVVFENKAAEQLPINGTLLKSKPVDQILAVMKMTGQIDYTIKYHETQKTVITIKK
ncbi:DUF4974 domain-containing protein [Marinilabiliaceae bacterium JC017]|nr:DUF4974 domain-containing protein [Marinilabiliaceae bacterium JC017]